MIEPLEKRVLYAAIFSTNSVKRLYTDPIGGDATGSRVVRYKNVTTKSVTIPDGGVVIGGAHAEHYRIISNFTLPRGLKPGASIKFSIVFDPPAGEDPGIKTGLLTVLTTTGATDAQSVNPNATGTITFDPGSTSFGLYATYPGLSRTAYTESALNTWESTIANRRKARFYPVRNKDHSIEPNTYLIAFEDLDSGEDFNDGVFIIRNVTTVA